MSFSGKFRLCLGALVLASTLTGCLPEDPGQMDEEKETHFIVGKSRVNTMDYAGAIESFQESLAANPHSAAAHYQLAWLFDSKEPVMDSAAAIYHYQEYLRLTPKADNTEVIRQRIYSCKQQLAADVMPLPSAPATMKQIEELTEKNRKLQEEVEQLRASNAALQAGLASSRQTSPTPDDISVHTPTAVPTTTVANPAATTVVATTNTNKSGSKPLTLKTIKPRTHVVVAGETLASISRKYRVNLSALQAANPGVSPKKMRVGQTLNLPPP